MSQDFSRQSSPVDLKSAQADSRVRQLFDEYLVQRAAGTAPAREAFLRQHEELRDLLAAELNKLDAIDRARSLAEQVGPEPDPQDLDAQDPATRETNVVLRCPHCQASTEVQSGATLVEMTCSGCGHPIRLVGQNVSRQRHDRLGRFELLEKLGSGAFGIVWRARDTSLDRDVALKVPHRRVMDPVEIEVVMREARVAAKLRHPHIVSVLEVGAEEQAVYIVSDLINGLTLQQWKDSQPMSFRATAELCRLIAIALDHAHEAGVVHRDLKPANILIDEDGEPHLTDFGLAKQTSDEISMTMDGHILGTPAYMSPEQARGQAHLCDRRSDVYSLGVILFELLTDELPFRGNMSVLPQKVIHDEPPSPRKFNRHVPRDLVTICLKCLEKAPAKRYATAGDVADELADWLAGMPIKARPVSKLGRGWRWSRRNPLAAGIAATISSMLLLITLALSLMIPVWRSRFHASIDEIQKNSNFVLQSLIIDVDETARNAADSTEVKRELVDETQGTAALQKIVDRAYDDSHHLYPSIDVANWFLLGSNGILRASSDDPNGERIVGKNFASRDYFQHAGLGAGHVGQPYLSLNDGRYKVPVAASIVDQKQVLGILVVSVSTPGTKALDHQRRFIQDLYLSIAFASLPLLVFLVVGTSHVVAERWRTRSQ